MPPHGFENVVFCPRNRSAQNCFEQSSNLKIESSAKNKTTPSGRTHFNFTSMLEFESDESINHKPSSDVVVSSIKGLADKESNNITMSELTFTSAQPRCSSLKARSSSSITDGHSIDKRAFLRTKRVSFAQVHIREYSTILGDHPCCQSGPPLSLGWDHSGTRVVEIDDFERSNRKSSTQRPMKLTCELRRLILSERNAAIDIKRAERRAYRQKKKWLVE